MLNCLNLINATCWSNYKTGLFLVTISFSVRIRPNSRCSWLDISPVTNFVFDYLRLGFPLRGHTLLPCCLSTLQDEVELCR